MTVSEHNAAFTNNVRYGNLRSLQPGSVICDDDVSFPVQEPVPYLAVDASDSTCGEMPDSTPSPPSCAAARRLGTTFILSHHDAHDAYRRLA